MVELSPPRRETNVRLLWVSCYIREIEYNWINDKFPDYEDGAVILFTSQSVITSQQRNRYPDLMWWVSVCQNIDDSVIIMPNDMMNTVMVLRSHFSHISLHSLLNCQLIILDLKKVFLTRRAAPWYILLIVDWALTHRSEDLRICCCRPAVVNLDLDWTLLYHISYHECDVWYNRSIMSSSHIPWSETCACSVSNKFSGRNFKSIVYQAGFWIFWHIEN